jgi:WD40 repeat protein
MRLREFYLLLFVGLAAATPNAAQQKKAVPSAPAQPDAADTCAHPYSGEGYATGWPEGPAYVLFHREDSKKPWSRNFAVQAPGLIVASPAAARTLVCVEEKLEEKGKYSSGEAAYKPSWAIHVLNLPDRKLYRSVSAPDFEGEDPPLLKTTPGPGIGAEPVKPFLGWLRLLVDQKVARFRFRMDWPNEVSGSEDFAGISAMAISQDGTKVAVARQSRNSATAPITVFDLVTGKPLSTLRAGWGAKHIALSASGNLIATEGVSRSGVEIWDTSTRSVVYRLDSPEPGSLAFEGEATLAVAAGGKATLWDVRTERQLRSVPASRVMAGPGGTLAVARRTPQAITLNEMESGRQMALFPLSRPINGSDYVLSPDGSVMGYLNSGNGAMLLSGESEWQNLELPSIHIDNSSIEAIKAMAPMSNGLVFAGDGFVGVASRGNPKPRFFATGESYVRNAAVSPDGKLLVLGSIESDLYVWELR